MCSYICITKRRATPSAITLWPPVTSSGAKLIAEPAVTTWSEGDTSDEPLDIPLARVCPSDTKVLVKFVCGTVLPVGTADATVCNCILPLRLILLKKGRLLCLRRLLACSRTRRNCSYQRLIPCAPAQYNCSGQSHFRCLCARRR
jgi:hypothetical protein